MIDRLHLRRNVVPLSPLPFPFGFSPHLLAQKSSLLYFHALTNCKFRNPFVLTFIQNAGGVPPPRAKIMNITIQEPADSLLSDPSRHSQSCSRNSRPGQIIAMISDSVNPFIYHPCGKLLRKILSRRRSPQIVSDRRTATVQRKVPWPRSLFFFPCC